MPFFCVDVAAAAAAERAIKNESRSETEIYIEKGAINCTKRLKKKKVFCGKWEKGKKKSFTLKIRAEESLIHLSPYKPDGINKTNKTRHSCCNFTF